MNAESVLLTPYGSDPLETLAALMLHRHQRELPDLSRHVVLVPNLGAVAPFQRALLAAARQAGHGGVLAPWCGTLDGWLQQTADDEAARIDDPERDLLLFDALQAYPTLRERYGTWTLVDSLLTLFDELNEHRSTVATGIDQFTAQLAAGYGVRESLAPLQGEAKLVYTLWNAWNEHLQNHNVRDRTLLRRTALAAEPSAAVSYHIYVVGWIGAGAAEADWLKRLQRHGHATLLMHGNAQQAGYHPDGAVRRCLESLGVAPPSPIAVTLPYSRFIETTFASDTEISSRARAFAADIPESPLRGRLQMFAASDFEQEARAVDLTVRRWYADGIRNIGIVTPDRKLARRVRALLERANISLRDTAGWALSTTSAATALMRWIECVEQDFAHAPLLDFLKSPFVTLGFANAELEPLIHYLEEQIVRAHNIGGGIDRYRRAIRTNETALAPALLQLLDRLTIAAEPLLKNVNGRAARSPSDHLTVLQHSLEKTGMAAGLATDDAGNQLLAALRPHRRLSIPQARLTWGEFRHWLQRELERRRFHPPLPESGVELLDLADSRCRQFDALILAGCTRDHLPGPAASSPFFNDGVRHQLGLPTREERLLAPLHDFRRLLDAAPRLLLTWRLTENGDDVVPSPWTERLMAFHRLAYGDAPDDKGLRELLAAKQTALHRRDNASPAREVVMPTPQLPRTRLPRTMSAASHQRLIDCPYQFYVVDGLGLRSPDEVRDEMEKTDYGENVHRILHAFHTGLPGLPGPWHGGPIGPENRAQAIALLIELGRHVFAYDTDKRLTTRGWHYRWENFVETYIDWQERRAPLWQVEATEKTLARDLAIGERTLTLKGRADRIDRGPDGLAIIDYKTGSIPSTDAVTAGEKAQLPFYALLHPNAVTEVLYAKFEKDSIKTNVGLKGGALAELVQQLDTRLRTLIAKLDAGTRLPAWGDAATCRYCRYEGLCRKELWAEEPHPLPIVEKEERKHR